MEEVISGLDNLYFTLENKDPFVEEQDSNDLVIVASVVTDRYVNLEALLKVFQWVKKRVIELKELD